MRLHPRVASLLRLGASAAGIALAVRAAYQIDGGALAAGLKNAGWALHLVLAPFVDFRALRRLLGKPVSLSAGRDASLRYLPLRLAPLALLATGCLLVGLVLEIAAQLK